MVFLAIPGGNAEKAIIPMTKPATMRAKPISGNREQHEGCIWAGTKWTKKKLPKPNNSKVYFQIMKRIVVYVR